MTEKEISKQKFEELLNLGGYKHIVQRHARHTIDIYESANITLLKNRAQSCCNYYRLV